MERFSGTGTENDIGCTDVEKFLKGFLFRWVRADDKDISGHLSLLHTIIGWKGKHRTDFALKCCREMLPVDRYIL
jgi:hypothetical protein